MSSSLHDSPTSQTASTAGSRTLTCKLGYRTLGRSGLRVAPLGFGSSYGAPSEAYEWAFEKGYNYFYWGTYRRCGMGHAIRQLAPKHRQNMVVAVQSYSRWPWLMEFSLKRALKWLKLDYSDVLLLGWYDNPPSEALLEKAEELRQKGLFKSLAISCHNRPLFARYINDKRFDIIMTRYNAAHRGAEREVFPHLDSLPEPQRPGVITYTTTRWGYLNNPKYTPTQEVTPTAAQCYRFALTNPHVNMALSGPASLKEMQDNIFALENASTLAMNEEEIAWIKRVGDHVHRATSKKLLTNPFMQRTQ